MVSLVEILDEFDAPSFVQWVARKTHAGMIHRDVSGLDDVHLALLRAMYAEAAESLKPLIKISNNGVSGFDAPVALCIEVINDILEDADLETWDHGFPERFYQAQDPVFNFISYSELPVEDRELARSLREPLKGRLAMLASSRAALEVGQALLWYVQHGLLLEIWASEEVEAFLQQIVENQIDAVPQEEELDMARRIGRKYKDQLSLSDDFKFWVLGFKPIGYSKS